jgi:hypothetical protein
VFYKVMPIVICRAACLDALGQLLSHFWDPNPSPFVYLLFETLLVQVINVSFFFFF